MLFRRTPNATQGYPSLEPPTPYSFKTGTSGLGIGVSNQAYQRSHTPPRDSVRGRQGLMVLRSLAALEPSFYIPRAALKNSNIVSNAAGVNETPGLEALFNPKAKQQ